MSKTSHNSTKSAKVALVTGGAGGLGKLIAQRLSDNGFELILVDNDSQHITKIKSDLNLDASANAKLVHVINCDVSNYEQVKSALVSFSQIDVVINAAGVLGHVEKFSDSDVSAWQKTIAVNLNGTANVCHVTLDRLRKSKHGKIINFAGGGAAYGRAHHAAYASSKAAVVRFSETLAIEEPTLDINSIAPGAHNTYIWLDEKFDKPPLKWADPVRFQDLITYLCCDESNGITGRFIHIYDDWDQKDYRVIVSDMLTMRRVDEQLLAKLK